MSFKVAQSGAVVSGGASVALSQLFSASGGGNPAYLVVCALDRDEYTAASTGSTGSLNGNGQTLALAPVDGDGRGAGIVYAWQASTGQYVNATYGTLSQLSYTASTSAQDVTSLSLFGAGSLAQATTYANNAFALIQTDAAGYLGSATVVANPANAASLPAMPPAAATPDSIAATALSFVGDAWNMDGCWVLASTIAAEAGAALPIQSTLVDVPGQSNGEWTVLYNGPASASANWQSLVGTGDVVCFGQGSGGHITTCVSGAGATARLVDNITYVDSSGTIVNLAHDGSPDDVLVSAPHPASQEWAGLNAADVVIYALGVPELTPVRPAVADVAGTALTLSGLVTASDPSHRSVLQYQVYDSLNGGSFLSGGAVQTAHSAASALSVASLGSVSLTDTQAGTDTLEVRAYDGAYWGDWQAVSVSVTAPVLLPPRMVAQMPDQVWQQGSHLSLTLPVLFSDPQQQALRYAVSGAGGAALPSWLRFDPATRTLSGVVPSGGIAAFAITVTATDTSGLSGSEVFHASIAAKPPLLAHQTPAQIWTEGGSIAFALPASTFADPQGQALSLRATQASGAALPGWLSFNPASATFLGTAPATVQTLSLRVTATDSSGLSAADTFGVSVRAPANAGLSLADWQPADILLHWAPQPTEPGATYALERHVAPMPVLPLPHGWHG